MTAPAVCVRRPGAVWTSCTCPDCSRANYRTKVLNSMGRVPRSPSERAWAAIDDRMAAGWSPSAIASAAGIPPRTLHGQIERYQRTGHRGAFLHATARALLTMGTPTEGYVGTHGATRRLRALTATGWSIADLAEHLPTVNKVTIWELRSRPRAHVKTPIHNAITELYVRLSGTPGHSVRARAIAVREGWVPPAGWDDDALDDPAAAPATAEPTSEVVDEVAVARALSGVPVHLTRAEREVAIPRLTAAGMSDHAIGRLLGVVAETILRDRQRLGVRPATAPTARAS